MNKKEKLEKTLESTARILCAEILPQIGGKGWSFHKKIHRDFNKPAFIWDEWAWKELSSVQPLNINGREEWYQYGKQVK